MRLSASRASARLPAHGMPSEVTVFLAVAIYISVGFLEQSALPAFLAHVELLANHTASPDDVSHAVTSHMGVCTFSLGIIAVVVAGWAGRLSDVFGRRVMAFVPAVGQACGMAFLAVAAYYELDWRFTAVAWALQGLCGGPYVFIAAAFAYQADCRQASAAAGRGRAFSRLDSLLLLVASAGPLVGAPLVSKVGFAGAFALCSGVYVTAALVFLFAPPSPQPPPNAAASDGRCSAWLATSTPAQLSRILCMRRLNVLCVAFICGLGGATGGAVSIVFYGQRYLGWKQQHLGYFFSAFSFLGAVAILVGHPFLSYLAGRRLPRARRECCPYLIHRTRKPIHASDTCEPPHMRA